MAHDRPACATGMAAETRQALNVALGAVDASSAWRSSPDADARLATLGSWIAQLARAASQGDAASEQAIWGMASARACSIAQADAAIRARWTAADEPAGRFPLEARKKLAAHLCSAAPNPEEESGIVNGVSGSWTFAEEARSAAMPSASVDPWESWARGAIEAEPCAMDSEEGHRSAMQQALEKALKSLRWQEAGAAEDAARLGFQGAVAMHEAALAAVETRWASGSPAPTDVYAHLADLQAISMAAIRGHLLGPGAEHLPPRAMLAFDAMAREWAERPHGMELSVLGALGMAIDPWIALAKEDSPAPDIAARLARWALAGAADAGRSYNQMGRRASLGQLALQLASRPDFEPKRAMWSELGGFDMDLALEMGTACAPRLSRAARTVAMAAVDAAEGKPWDGATSAAFAQALAEVHGLARDARNHAGPALRRLSQACDRVEASLSKTLQPEAWKAAREASRALGLGGGAPSNSNAALDAIVERLASPQAALAANEVGAILSQQRAALDAMMEANELSSLLEDAKDKAHPGLSTRARL